MTDERWLPVPGYEGLYEVSDQGRVRSLDRLINSSYGAKRRHTGRVLIPHLKDDGHLTVTLARDGTNQRGGVHRLVLLAFVGPCPEDMQGCHNNGVPADNRLENLRWDTSSANKFDAVRHGTHHQTRKTKCPLEHAYVQRGSRRDCNECARLRRRRRAEQRRQLLAAQK